MFFIFLLYKIISVDCGLQKTRYTRMCPRSRAGRRHWQENIQRLAVQQISNGSPPMVPFGRLTLPNRVSAALTPKKIKKNPKKIKKNLIFFEKKYFSQMFQKCFKKNRKFSKKFKNFQKKSKIREKNEKKSTFF